MLFLVDIFCFFIIMKHKGECYFQYFTNIMCLELFGNAFTLCMFVFFFLKKKKKKNPKKGYTLVLLYREHGKHTHMDHRIRGVSSAIISRLTRVIKEDESPSTPW
jgi:hypothetical protein